MPTHQEVIKGFVKTENAILLMAVTLVIGFIAGVAVSAFRSSSQLTGNSPGAVMPKPTLDSQQLAAQAALIKQTQDTPNDAQAWIQLGHFYFDTGNHEKAINSYETAIDIDDTQPNVWTDLGVMYRRNEKPQKAIDCFDRALALDPAHEIAMFNKGIVLMHDLQDTQGALESWKRLIKVNPNAHTPNGLLVREMVAELVKTNDK